MRLKNFIKISKWIARRIRPFILYFTGIVIFGTIISLLGVGFAIASKLFIDYMTSGNLPSAAIVGVVYIVIILADKLIRRKISILSANVHYLVSNRIRQ